MHHKPHRSYGRGAGVIVAVLGESVAFAYSQIYSGKQPLDIAWIESVIQDYFESDKVIEKMKSMFSKIRIDSDPKEIISVVVNSISSDSVVH